MSKVNIFNTLPQYTSDHEDDEVPTQKTQGKQQSSRNQGDKPRRDDNKQGKQDTKQSGKGNQEANKESTQKKESNSQNQAKGGQKDNKRREQKEQKEVEPKGEKVEAGETQKVEEEKPEGITLEEYYQSHKLAQNQPQVNEIKAKITSEQLIKELGKSTLLKGKNTQQVDDRKAGKKKDHLDVNHKAGLTTEHGDLLGFRTGFIDKEYKPRNPEDREFNKDGQRTGGKYGRREKRETEEAIVENTEAQKTEGQTQEVQGENQTQTGETQQTEGKAHHGQDYFNRRKNEEGYSYDRKKQQFRGGNRGGPRQQGERRFRPEGERKFGQEGDRKPYGGYRKPNQTQINVTDESAFPKLG